jgi:retron-type reverse transcriptase
MENLQLADKKARSGKLRSHGVIKHDRNREANLAELHKTLTKGLYRTSPYDTFIIHEPKERQICRLPYFPDRIVHHAVVNVLEPIWVSTFTADSFSCIKGRGIHAAAEKMKSILRENPQATKYCLKIDLRKFYPSIDHDILKQIIRRKIKDGKLLALLDEIIGSAEGIPIGNYLSQHFANLYLTRFDHWIKERQGVKYYLRYADDIVALHSDKQFLHRLFADMRDYLAGNLKLEIKGNRQIFPVTVRGIDFVGYVFYHTHTRLRKGIKKRFCRRLARLNRRETLTEAEFKRRISPWWGWAKHCDSINLINKLSQNYRYEIKF